MSARRLTWAAVGAIAVFALTSCGGSSKSSSSAPSPATSTSSTPTSTTGSSTSSKTWSIVALGDSVPSGYNCSCTPYPQLSASGLASMTGQTVKATNAAVAGFTTASVLNQLQSDSTVVDQVRKADAVEINIGANDVPYKNSCGTKVDCYAPLVPPMQKNLAAIVSSVHDLTSGHKVLVVLLDYWSIWLGGTYARSKGHEYVSAARQMTAHVDAAIKTTAIPSGTHYLTSDGDHPNATGHQAIATATESVIKNGLDI